ncbi:family superfamily protein [Stylonychia lemnae]|uniref:Family superfamily protein n=1 Tax=Stylonychia lemnae TaxID=5949 RepID=A0A078AWU0_STYLE|nr:family superfamily protein [Stylonychia lemnae]|eukprot:CDW86521.1 family superfamily protein [Stylonychia lemnae]
MQSGDQIKETLNSALGLHESTANSISPQSSQRNSLSLSELGSPDNLSNNADSKPAPKIQTRLDDALQNIQQIALSLSPTKDQTGRFDEKSSDSDNLRQRRGTAVVRQESYQLRNVRPRLFSQDVLEIQLKKIEQAKTYKKKALAYYKNEDYFDSLTFLHKSVKVFKIEQLTEDVKLQNEEIFQLIKECYLYSASCYIKINQFDSAIQLMNELLLCEQDNVKALNLRAKAHYNRNQILKCYIDLSTALKLQPDSDVFTKFIAKLESNYPELKQQYQDYLEENQNEQQTVYPQNKQLQIPQQNDKYEQTRSSTMQSVGSGTTHSNSNSTEQIPLLQRNGISLQHPASPSMIKINGEQDQENQILKGNSRIQSSSIILRILMSLKAFIRNYKPYLTQTAWTVVILLVMLAIRKLVTKYIPDSIKRLI